MAIGRNRFRLGQELAIFSKSGDADFLGGDNEKVCDGSDGCDGSGLLGCNMRLFKCHMALCQ